MASIFAAHRGQIGG